MSEDESVIKIVVEGELMQKCISVLKLRTIDDEEEGKEGEEEEAGVRVGEKNGILGIVLEVVEGGGWKRGYEELEEVVGRLEEEGEQQWRERRKQGSAEEGRRGKNGGKEWREMKRLARDVGWAIEEQKKKEEEGNSEGIVTLGRMKKELEEEKKGREEEKKRADEEKKGREEERRKKEEEKSRADEEKRMKEEEKRKREESEKRTMEEKAMKENEKKRADKLEAELRTLKERQKEESKITLITSLQSLPYYVTNGDEVTRTGNRLSHTGRQSSIIGPELKSVCYCTFAFVISSFLHSTTGYISNVFLSHSLLFISLCLSILLSLSSKFSCIKVPSGCSFFFFYSNSLTHFLFIISCWRFWFARSY